MLWSVLSACSKWTKLMRLCFMPAIWLYVAYEIQWIKQKRYTWYLLPTGYKITVIIENVSSVIICPSAFSTILQCI